MKYYQQAIKYLDVYQKEMLIATFWTDEDNNPDSDAINDRELKLLLKTLMLKSVAIESTGNMIEDE